MPACASSLGSGPPGRSRCRTANCSKKALKLLCNTRRREHRCLCKMATSCTSCALAPVCVVFCLDLCCRKDVCSMTELHAEHRTSKEEAQRDQFEGSSWVRIGGKILTRPENRAPNLVPSKLVLEQCHRKYSSESQQMIGTQGFGTLCTRPPHPRTEET